MNDNRMVIYCDCCGTEKLAEIVEGKLVIMDRRHGKRHIFSERIDTLAKFVQSSGNLQLTEHKAVRQVEAPNE